MNLRELDHLAAELGAHLQQNNWHLVTAESCTGGWLAEAVTAIAGSSAWFDRGFITYSNVAKQEMLGVSSETLAKYGAVSKQTVLEMVNGALAHSHAQVGVAISGIAGPSGGTPDKPIGTVWIAYAVPHNVYAQHNYFRGGRFSIRQQAVMTVLERLAHGL
ncbi:CinA family protein [Candidatus Parabeggiatoa sp. HSG14]|uniref:CinA family protein n=1 Tax=Candidatus Parabeggiatoa sp. HSG14 TaxID=3055593 RepID=UPI0025A6BD30|nr:CinA family protein [Thiotrichales bacterium HSG14]